MITALVVLHFASTPQCFVRAGNDDRTFTRTATQLSVELKPYDRHFYYYCSGIDSAGQERSQASDVIVQ